MKKLPQRRVLKSEKKKKVKIPIGDINRKLDQIYTTMIDSLKNKKTKNLKWKSEFMNIMERDKVISFKNITEDLIPSSLSENGVCAFKNFKFWDIYTNYFFTKLDLDKLINLTRLALRYIIDHKARSRVKLNFAAKIGEKKIQKYQIEQYCKEHGITVDNTKKYYDYLLEEKGKLDAGKQNFHSEKIVKILPLQENKILLQPNNIQQIQPQKEAPVVKEEPKIKKIEFQHKEPENLLDRPLTEEELKKIKASPMISLVDFKSIDDSIANCKKTMSELDHEMKNSEIHTPMRSMTYKNVNIIKVRTPKILPSEKNSLLPGLTPITPLKKNEKEQEEAENDSDLEDSYVKYLKEVAAQRGDSPSDVLDFGVTAKTPNVKRSHTFTELSKSNDSIHNSIIYSTVRIHSKKVQYDIK